MSQQDAVVAARVRARRRNTGIAMGFGLLLCLAGAVWAFNTLGQVGDRAAVELVPETTLPSIPDPAATPVDGTTPPRRRAPPPAGAGRPDHAVRLAVRQHRLRHQRAVRPLRRRGEVLGRRRRRRPTAPAPTGPGRGGRPRPGRRSSAPRTRWSAPAAARSRTAATSRSATTPAPPARRACAAPRRAPGSASRCRAGRTPSSRPFGANYPLQTSTRGRLAPMGHHEDLPPGAELGDPAVRHVRRGEPGPRPRAGRGARPRQPAGRRPARPGVRARAGRRHRGDGHRPRPVRASCSTATG